MKFSLSILTFAISALFAVTSSAEDGNLGDPTSGYVYFNRIGADLTNHNKELTTCMQEVSKVWPPLNKVRHPYGLAGDLVWTGPIRAVSAVNVENCMVVRGWRLIRLDPIEGKALSLLPLTDLVARMEPWIGSDSPHGAITRVFMNDATRASTIHFNSRPNYFAEGQLSQRLNSKQPTLTRDIAAMQAFYEVPKFDKKWPAKPLNPTELESAPPGSALIITRVKGQSLRLGLGLVFEREGVDKNDRPHKIDNDPDLIGAGIGLMYKKAEGNWFIYAVPAGTWRIKSARFSNFCWGSPSFEVRPGDVIYTGAFDLAAESLLPDQSIETVEQYLSGTAAAKQVKAAIYTNGSTGACAPNSIYALEFEGASFRPGYKWGSRATSPPAN